MNNLVQYKNLKKEYLNYNAWKNDDAFSLKGVDLKVLDSYEIKELVFEGIENSRNEDLFKQKITKFKQGLEIEFFKKDRKNVYIYSIEHKKKTLSRLRSYKGLLDKKNIKSDDFFQSEIDLDNKQTIISFVAILNKKNIDYLFDFFFDDSITFVVKSDHDCLNLKFLKQVLYTLSMDTKEFVELDFFKLMILFCKRNDLIYRIGGNSGEDYWSLQELKLK